MRTAREPAIVGGADGCACLMLGARTRPVVRVVAEARLDGSRLGSLRCAEAGARFFVKSNDFHYGIGDPRFGGGMTTKN